MNCYLFVYGTLRKGHPGPMSRFLFQRAEFIGRARTAGRLYDLGGYPGLVEPETVKECVSGDVYRLEDPEKILNVLDQYEGCEDGSSGPCEFERCVCEVTLNDGTTLETWVYRYRGNVTAGSLQEGS